VGFPSHEQIKRPLGQGVGTLEGRILREVRVDLDLADQANESQHGKPVAVQNRAPARYFLDAAAEVALAGSGDRRIKLHVAQFGSGQQLDASWTGQEVAQLDMSAQLCRSLSNS